MEFLVSFRSIKLNYIYQLLLEYGWLKILLWFALYDWPHLHWAPLHKLAPSKIGTILLEREHKWLRKYSIFFVGFKWKSIFVWIIPLFLVLRLVDIVDIQYELKEAQVAIYNGEIYSMYLFATIKLSCDCDVTDFPFDLQKRPIVFNWDNAFNQSFSITKKFCLLEIIGFVHSLDN